MNNPYPGLRPFQAKDYRLFFGRGKQVDELLDRLDQNRFIAVVGVSGSGKSSLVRAGLLPRLCGGFMSEAGSRWLTVVLRPGAFPMKAMWDSLDKGLLCQTSASIDRQKLQQDFELSGKCLIKIAAATLRQRDGAYEENLLIIVDQFEELFTFNASPEASSPEGLERADEQFEPSRAFVDRLMKASQQFEVPIYVVITMRSDYLGDCARFRDFPELLNQSQYLIPRMTLEELWDAIQRPAKLGDPRATVDRKLFNRLLDDLNDEPRNLPRLQHLLMRTWEEWSKRSAGVLPDQDSQSETPQAIENPTTGSADSPKTKLAKGLALSDYKLAGEFENALNQHAEDVFLSLQPGRQRDFAELIFKRITAQDVSDRYVRRPTKLEDIYEVLHAQTEEVKGEVRAVIKHFMTDKVSFITSPDLEESASGELTPDSMIDINHESLIYGWKRLKDWVAAEARSAEHYRWVVRYEANKTGWLQQGELDYLDSEFKPDSLKGWNSAWSVRYAKEKENQDWTKVKTFLEGSHHYQAELRKLEQERGATERAAQDAVERGKLERKAADAENRALALSLEKAELAAKQAELEREAARREAEVERGQLERKAADAENRALALSLEKAELAAKQAELEREAARREAEVVRGQLERKAAVAEQQAATLRFEKAAEEAERAGEAEKRRQKRKVKRLIFVAGVLFALAVGTVVGVALIARQLLRQVAGERVADNYASQSENRRAQLGSDTQQRAALLEIMSFRTYQRPSNTGLDTWETYDRIKQPLVKKDLDKAKKTTPDRIFVIGESKQPRSIRVIVVPRPVPQSVLKPDALEPVVLDPDTLEPEPDFLPRHLRAITALSHSGRYAAAPCFKNKAVIWDIAVKSPLHDSLMEPLSVSCGHDLVSVEENSEKRLFITTEIPPGDGISVQPTVAAQPPAPGTQPSPDMPLSPCSQITPVAQAAPTARDLYHLGKVSVIAFSGTPICISPSLPIMKAALSADGGYLAVVQNLGGVISFELVNLLDPGKRVVLSDTLANLAPFAFSPSGRYLAIGTADNKLKLFDLQNGSPDRVSMPPVCNINPIAAVAFSHDSTMLAAAEAYGDNIVRVVKLKEDAGKTHPEILWSDYFGLPARQLTFSQKDEFLGLALDENTARVKEAKSGFEFVRVAFSSRVNSIDFSPYDQDAFAVTEQGQVSRIATHRHAKSPVWADLPCIPQNVALSANGRVAIAACQQFAEGSTTSFRPVAEIFTPDKTAPDFQPQPIDNGDFATKGSSCLIAISSSGLLAASECERLVPLPQSPNQLERETKRGSKAAKPNQMLRHHIKLIRTKDNTAIFDWDIPKEFAQRETKSIDKLRCQGVPSALALSPDGSDLGVGDDCGLVLIFHTSSVDAKSPPSPIKTIPLLHSEIREAWRAPSNLPPYGPQPITALAFSQKATMISTGTLYGGLFVRKTDEPNIVLWSKHYDGSIGALEFSPVPNDNGSKGGDSTELVFGAGGTGGVLRTTDAGREVFTRQASTVITTVAFGSDGQEAVFGGLDGKISIYSRSSGEDNQGVLPLLFKFFAHYNLAAYPDPAETWSAKRTVYSVRLIDRGKQLVVAADKERVLMPIDYQIVKPQPLLELSIHPLNLWDRANRICDNLSTKSSVPDAYPTPLQYTDACPKAMKSSAVQPLGLPSQASVPGR